METLWLYVETILLFLKYIYNFSFMIETRSKKNPIVGYMGYGPANEGIGQQDPSAGIIDSHVPGYVGYIPAVKS